MYHLMERYGKIRPYITKACRQALTEPIEVERPSNVYFQRVEDTTQSAQYSTTPFTVEKIVQAAYHAVNKTGMYSLAL